MSKQEESKLDKLKHMLGIRGHRGVQGSGSSSTPKPITREFIFTDELLKEIGPQSPTSQRIRTVRDLQEVVLTKQLEPNAVEAIWQEVKDMLKPQASKEERHIVLKFMQCLIKGQHEQLKELKEYFFRVIKAHTVFEDFSPRLDVLQALTLEGKDLEYIEDEIGIFLLESMKDVMSSERIPDFLKLVVNVIKFNAAYLDEDVVAGIVVNTCLIATKTEKDEEVEICLKLLDTIICYSYLPLSSLNHFVFCLCQVLNVEMFSSNTWQLMKKLLGTHVGHSAIHTMCCTLQDSGSTGSSAFLLRGAVFFISMSLWGPQRVPSLKYPPNAVLPTFLQSLMQSGDPVLANEIVLSVQHLISGCGSEQPIVTWHLILDIIQRLLELIESNPGISTVLVKNVHDLLSSIEKLHEQNEFHGSDERFFSIIEMCANSRPESSILMLITHKVQFIYPSVKDNWILKLKYLVDKYFKQEKRTKIRLKVLEVVKQIVIKNKYLYEEDLIKFVVVPHLINIDQSTDVEVKTKAVDLVLDLVESSQSPCAKELIDILFKVINRPFMVGQPVSTSSSQSQRERPRSIIEESDVMPALIGLIKLFKIKLYETPFEIAVTLFELLVEHLLRHYTQKPLFLQTTARHVRYKILELLLALRADANQRLGLYDKNKSGSVTYSSYVVCCQQNKSGEQCVIQPAEDKVAMMSYADVFKCITLCLEKEMDWNVLKLVLDNLPLVLQNKTLLLVANLGDIERFCARLQALVSGHNQNHLEKLLNVPANMSKSDFHNCIFPVLTCLVSYHDVMDKQKQRDLVKCLEFGLVSKCARICVQALTVCALEMDDIMMRQLPSVLLNLSKISATVAMAIPLMEFLSSLIHCPHLYSNFVEDQYLSVFAIALPYTNPFKYNHYTVSLAYNVIGLWFVKCRVSFRKGFVGFILQGLKSNVLRQIEEMNSQKTLLNQDSVERSRTQSLNDEVLRTDESSKESHSRAAAASARSRKSQSVIPMAPLDEDLSIFHKELMETCVDMLARYTFSTRSNIPKRSPVADFLLKGGQSESWMLGNRIITITTSGGSKVGRAGLCEKCLLAARVASSKLKSPKLSMNTESVGRRRHKSAAVHTVQESVSVRQHSQDDILLHSHRSVMPEVLEVGEQRSSSFELPEIGSSDESINVARVQAPLETRTDKIQAVDNVLMSLRAKPSDKSIFSPHLCNCWCTQWAEIHIRRPTGTFSWIMRIQNEEDVIDSFPDFPLADICSLFMSDKIDEDVVDNTTQKIDNTALPEMEYESLWTEHFKGSAPSVCSAQGNLECNVTVPSQSNVDTSIQSSSEALPGSTLMNQSQCKVIGPSKGNVTDHQQDDVPTDGAEDSKTQLPAAMSKPLKSSSQSHSRNDKVGSSHDDRYPTEEGALGMPSLSFKERPSVTPEGKTVSLEKDPFDQMSQQIKSCSPQHDVTVRSSGHSLAGGVSHPAGENRTKDIMSHKKTPPSSKTNNKSAMCGSVFGKEGPIQGGMNPGFLFLQLYHASFFGSSDDRPLHLPSTESVKRSLKMLDMIYPFQTHKIGVIYVAPGQVDNEVAILSNQYGSSRYIEFIQGLGQIVRLQDCNTDMTYLGGLDSNGSDGQFTYIWQDEVLQLVYHIATMMPNKESDPNCTKKKLHIGNNHVTIVYNDSKMDYKIGTIKGQYNYVNIIIQPLDLNSNAVTVQTRDDIVDIIGHTDTKIISDSHLSALVRQMALHADVASIILQRQKSNPKDLFASNWLERLRQIKRIRTKVKQETSQTASSGSSSTFSREAQGIMGGLNIIDDFTDFVS